MVAGKYVNQGHWESSDTSKTSLWLEKKQSDITIQWLTDQAMTVIWEDGARNEILLKSYQLIPDMQVPCIFKGSSKSDPTIVATIIGCKNGTDTMISIGSKDRSIKDLILRNNITLEDMVVRRSKRQADEEDFDYYEFYANAGNF